MKKNKEFNSIPQIPKTPISSERKRDLELSALDLKKRISILDNKWGEKIGKINKRREEIYTKIKELKHDENGVLGKKDRENIHNEIISLEKELIIIGNEISNLSVESDFTKDLKEVQRLKELLKEIEVELSSNK